MENKDKDLLVEILRDAERDDSIRQASPESAKFLGDLADHLEFLFLFTRAESLLPAPKKLWVDLQGNILQSFEEIREEFHE